MKTRFQHLLLLYVLLIAVGCGGRDSSPAESGRQEPSSEQAKAPAAESLSREAAAAFSDLPSVELEDSGALRTFRIEPASSRAAYIVDEEFFAEAKRKYGLEPGKAEVIGETQDVTGVVQIDLFGASLGPNRFAVYLPTLRTDQKLRDGWIRENALESDRYPVALFVATQIDDAPSNYREGETVRFQMEGDLTLRGVSLPSRWHVEAILKDGIISGSLETRLRMTDLGFDPPNFANTLTVQDEFTIRIEFVANER